MTADSHGQFYPTTVKNPEDYEFRKHILNSYYCLKTKVLEEKLLMRYSDNKLVHWCGNSFSKSTKCADCRICEQTYEETKLRMAKRN